VDFKASVQASVHAIGEMEILVRCPGLGDQPSHGALRKVRRATSHRRGNEEE
jgi:hypothetical protein